jgi:hypothetical protein
LIDLTRSEMDGAGQDQEKALDLSGAFDLYRIALDCLYN